MVIITVTFLLKMTDIFRHFVEFTQSILNHHLKIHNSCSGEIKQTNKKNQNERIRNPSQK